MKTMTVESIRSDYPMAFRLAQQIIATSEHTVSGRQKINDLRQEAARHGVEWAVSYVVAEHYASSEY